MIHFDSVVKRGERVFSMEIFKNTHGNRMDKWRAVEGATQIGEEAMYCSLEKNVLMSQFWMVSKIET